MGIVAIIPARYRSTRLPGKPLSDIHGKPLVQHVYERARRARCPERVLVATDDDRIVAAVHAFGGEVVLTSSMHATGTDRLGEVAARLEAEVLVNVQGDEPLLDPDVIDSIVEPFTEGSVQMTTASAPFATAEEMRSESVVKVVTDAGGDALYFSRSPIPHPGGQAGSLSLRLGRRHVGIYAYRRTTLLRLASLPPCDLEAAESLEQLRALYHGVRIRVVPVRAHQSMAVDTPEDLERVRALMAPRP